MCVRSKTAGVLITLVVLLTGLLVASSAHAQGAGGVPTSGAFRTAALSNDGRFVAWEDNDDSVYVRNLDSGRTVRASIQPGPNAQVGYWPSISGDGRYVTFIDSNSGTGGDVWVTDTITGTVTRVTPPGPGPPPAGYRAQNPQISADGRYVAIDSYYSCTVCAGGGSSIWVKDLQTGSFTRADVANGAGGAAANDRSNRPAISGDGRYVAFASKATNLSPDDTDSNYDVYVRDIQANTTELVSRASGVNGVNTPNDSHTPEISLDGRYVSFGTYTDIDPADTNGAWDIYLRDRQSATTTLVSRASGVAGPVGNAGAKQDFGFATRNGLSTDGRFVSFTSQSTNLSPDDTDSNYDAYVRDLQTNTTLLVSRASGTTGAKAAGGENNGDSPALSDNGRVVAFTSQATNLDPDRPTACSFCAHLYVRDLQTNITTLENRLSSVYARPKAATPLNLQLVPAYHDCASPNRQHGGGLSFGSCAPPTQTSARLTVGTPDANMAPAKSVSLVKAAVIPGNGATPADEADVNLVASMTDIRNASDLSDYTGELEARISLQVTDKINVPSTGGIGPGTAQQFDLSFAIPCSTTPDTTIGASCDLATSADTLIPGAATEGARAIWRTGAVEVYDGGTDGDGDTPADDTLFLTQGVFVP